MGDFNLPNITWETLSLSHSNSSERQFLQFCTSNGYEQLVTEPTRGANILDLILCNKPSLISTISVNNFFFPTDHKALGFEITANNTQTTKTEPCLNFSKADFKAINVFLAQVNWGPLLESYQSIQDKYDLFLEIISAAIQLYVPIRKSGQRKQNLPKHIVRLVQRQKRLHALYKSTGSEADLSKWKSANQLARVAIRKFQQTKEDKIVKNRNENFWRLVSSRMKSKPSLPVLQSVNGKCTDSKSKADLLNKHFASVFITDKNENKCEGTCATGPVCKLDIQQVDIVEVYNTLCHLPNKYSVGTDGIPQIFLKNAAVPLALPLSMLFNYSLSTATLPHQWVSANITPVFKKGVSSEPSNYRPISITSTVCRVFEKIIKK
ncbi:MAG: hypothetical protein P8X78_04945, partial [Nitrosopumilaceae archaeon]